MSVAAWGPENLPGFANARLGSVAPSIGVRESRRIVGEHVRQLADGTGGRRFHDAIARSACNVDLPPHDDKGTWFETEDAGDIPFRCLVPTGVDNPLVAGRCISTTHEASGSARMTPHVAATGKAAGTAAAPAAGMNLLVRDLDVAELQDRLLDDTVNLRRKRVIEELAN